MRLGKLASYLKARMWNSCWAVDFWQRMSVRCRDGLRHLLKSTVTANSEKHVRYLLTLMVMEKVNTSRASGRSSVAAFS